MHAGFLSGRSHEIPAATQTGFLHDNTGLFRISEIFYSRTKTPVKYIINF